jgi:hypothetical protein
MTHFIQMTGGQATIRQQHTSAGTPWENAHGLALYDSCQVQNPRHRTGRFYGLSRVHIYCGSWVGGSIDIGLHPDDPNSNSGTPCKFVVLEGTEQNPLVIDSRGGVGVHTLRIGRGNHNVVIGPHVRLFGDQDQPWSDTLLSTNENVEIMENVTYNGQVVTL